MSVYDNDYDKESIHWAVQVSAADLLKAAATKKEYHEGRLTHWHSEYDTAVVELKASVEFREATARYGNNTVSANDIDMVADPQKKKHLQECIQKVQTHTELVKTFSSWVSFFTRAKPTDNFPCDFQAFEELGL